jgi:Protein of unknown function (DUF1553)/Protein of unknown function (DUF1549)
MRPTWAVLGLGCAAFALLSAESRSFSDTQKKWWAFQPVAREKVPSVRNQGWVKTPIDAFVIAKLEESGLKPNPPADKLTLLRRVTEDMTGLPPSPEEIQQFLSDSSPNAYEKVVDRLLASPHYGERWGRHWLDLARYADSNGFKADETRPDAWRYRDYVIKSFNSDKPYNQFVREQIAGDELYPHDPEALVGTGFLRNFPDESNAQTLFLRRQEYLNEITDAVGATFIGMTYSCARCHDHKFDPILHKDYYRLQAFFANTVIGDGPLPLLDPVERKKRQDEQAQWEQATAAIRAQMSQLVSPVVQRDFAKGLARFPEDVQQAITAKDRTPLQWQIYEKALPQLGMGEGYEDADARKLRPAGLAQYNALKASLAKFNSLKPVARPTAQFMIDAPTVPPPTHVLASGNVDAPLEEVQPGFLSILDPRDAKIVAPGEVRSSGRRGALAEWLTDPKNPLVARVMVNRVWNYNFGKGIVATPSDFGKMGSRPSHPELLDYLATTFVEGGWSVKKLQRMILLSSVYQQSSEFQTAAAKTDPDNKLLWRFNRRRLEGEAIRDSMLFTSGLLNLKEGGPGVFPPIPAGTVLQLASKSYSGWKKHEDAEQANRRSVYIFVRRNLRYPMMQEFDTADTTESCAFRKNTVTPAQSLELLNNDLVLDWARAFAGRVLNDTGLTADAQIDRAFTLAFGRAPTAEERKSANAFLQRQVPIMTTRMLGLVKPPVPANLPRGIDPARGAAFVDLCHMLMDSNEFLYMN